MNGSQEGHGRAAGLANLKAAGKWQSSVLSLVVLPSIVSPPGFIGGPLTHITMLSLELLVFTLMLA